MAWFDDLNLPGATIDGFFGYVTADGPDADDNPDVVLAHGWVTFTATTPAARVDGAWLGIQSVRAQIFEGQIVVSEEDPRPVRLLATDANIGVADWAWKATFDIKGFTLAPLTFKAPRDTTVNLTADLIPIKSQPYQIIEGASIVDAEVSGDGTMRFELSDGSYTSWIDVPNGERGLPGEKGDPGAKGADGAAATLAMGSVTAGTTADAWMTGTPLARELHLTLPRGQKGDRGETGPRGPGATDPQVASWVSDPETQTAMALRRTLTPDLIRSLRSPVQIAHRGGSMAWPEHSMEAYTAAYDAGYTPEADVQALADGTLVCIHDTTTGRTMTGPSVAVADMSLADWESRRVLPVERGGVTSTGYGTPVLFDDYLDRFGGRAVLFVEAKGSSHVPAIMEAITARGLLSSVVVQSNAIAGVNAIVAAGGTALHLTTEDPVATAGRGAKFVGVPASATAAHVAACHAAGLKVIMYTLNSRSAVVDALAKGVDGIFSDDPSEVFRPVVPARHLDLSRDYPGPGLAVKGGANLLAKVDGGALTVGGDSARTYVKLGAFGYGADRLRVRFWVQGLAATTTAGWLFGLYLGSANDDLPVTESAADGTQWRLLLCRTDGEKRLYRREYGGATVQMAEQPVTSGQYFPTDGTPGPAMQFEVEFTATQVIARNLTRNDEPLIGTAASLSESGQYLNIAAYYSTIRVWDVQVTRG